MSEWIVRGYEVIWKAEGDYGKDGARGVSFYESDSEDSIDFKKMLWFKQSTDQTDGSSFWDKGPIHSDEMQACLAFIHVFATTQDDMKTRR
jgi:hypothetical protein